MKRGANSTNPTGPVKFRTPETPDLRALLELAHHKSEAGRAALAAIADALFRGGNGRLSDRERALMQDMLRTLIGGVETSLRNGCADILASAGGTPSEAIELVRGTGDDEVAVSPLVGSGVLRDPELVEIVKHRAQAYRLGVTLGKRREGEAAAENAGGDRLIRLLKESDEAVAGGVMEHLAAEARTFDTFQRPVVLAEDLPLDVARRLHWWIAAALRQHFLASPRLDWATVDKAMEGAVEAALDRLAETRARPGATRALIEEIGRTGGLTEDLLLDFLGQGEVALFEAGLARLAGLRPILTGRLLYEPGGEGLAVAFRGAGLSRSAFTKVFRVTRLARLTPEAVDASDLERVEAFFERIPDEVARDVLVYWQRDRDYLFSINRLSEKE